MTVEEVLHAHNIRCPTKPGRHYTICPQCSADRKKPHQKLKCLGVTIGGDDRVCWGCNHCGWTGPEKGVNKGNGKDRSFSAIYSYLDEEGELLFQVCRRPNKQFPQRRPDGNGGWLWKTGDVRKVLYRLPELIEAIAADHPVLVVEGEKDADNLRALGLAATCSPGGAAKPGQQSKWRKDYSETLRGGDIVIVPDNDEAGRAHAETTAAASLGIAARVRILDLAEHWPDIPAGGDISDWLDAGHTREQLDALIAAARDVIEAPAPAAPPAHANSYQPTEAWWRDPETIQPRQWLYDRHYIRKSSGATIGAGGRAKTTLSHYEAISMAVGRDLATRELLPTGPLRVLALNGEEDQDELDRRIAATCQHYKISKADLGGRLFAKSVRDKPLRLATLVKNAPALNHEALDRLEADIRAKRIDVFMLDPWVSFHSVLENDNGHMDLLIKEGLGGIASRTNTAGEVFHHPGKPKPGQETTVEDARGASAIIWAVRNARVLNFMTPDEAGKLGISEDDRRLHIKIANGKANMGPLGKAKWMHLLIENLPNGDGIAVASHWTPPDPFQGVTAAHMELARQLARTGEYRADSRSPKWFGYAIADALKIAATYGANNDRKDLTRLNAIIKTWLQNRVLEIGRRKDDKGKDRNFIVAGSFKPEPQPATYPMEYVDDDIAIH